MNFDFDEAPSPEQETTEMSHEEKMQEILESFDPNFEKKYL